MAAKKSTVNSAGNYTKPDMRKRLFNKIKAGSKGGDPGEWSARKAQLLAWLLLNPSSLLKSGEKRSGLHLMAPHRKERKDTYPPQPGML